MLNEVEPRIHFRIDTQPFFQFVTQPGVNLTQRDGVQADLFVCITPGASNAAYPPSAEHRVDLVGQPWRAWTGHEKDHRARFVARLFHQFPFGRFDQFFRFGTFHITHEARRQLNYGLAHRDTVLFDQQQLLVIRHGDDGHSAGGFRALDIFPAATASNAKMFAFPNRNPFRTQVAFHASGAYSYRSASIGSTRAARRAGNQQASNATPPINTTTAT